MRGEKTTKFGNGYTEKLSMTLTATPPNFYKPTQVLRGRGEYRICGVFELRQCYQLQKCLADARSGLALLASTAKSAEMNNNLFSCYLLIVSLSEV